MVSKDHQGKLWAKMTVDMEKITQECLPRQHNHSRGMTAKPNLATVMTEIAVTEIEEETTKVQKNVLKTGASDLVKIKLIP